MHVEGESHKISSMKIVGRSPSARNTVKGSSL